VCLLACAPEVTMELFGILIDLIFELVNGHPIVIIIVTAVINVDV
jgi:hypothetical protein